MQSHVIMTNKLSIRVLNKFAIANIVHKSIDENITKIIKRQECVIDIWIGARNCIHPTLEWNAKLGQASVNSISLRINMRSLKGTCYLWDCELKRELLYTRSPYYCECWSSHFLVFCMDYLLHSIFWVLLLIYNDHMQCVVFFLWCSFRGLSD